MTALFEKVVRPNQSRDIRPPRRKQTSAGASGSGPVSVILGGTPSAGAEVSFLFSSTALPGSPVTVTYVVQGGDTIQNVVTGIVNAINADPSLIFVGITATGVSGSTVQFTINQPASLNPQASMLGSATDSLTVSVSTGNINVQPGRGRVQAKWSGGNYNISINTYNEKWPREMTMQEKLNSNLPPYTPPPFNPRV